jgi:hypothetical protein
MTQITNRNAGNEVCIATVVGVIKQTASAFGKNDRKSFVGFGHYLIGLRH